MDSKFPNITVWQFNTGKTVHLPSNLAIRVIGMDAQHLPKTLKGGSDDFHFLGQDSIEGADLTLLYRDRSTASSINLESKFPSKLILIAAPEFRRGRGGGDDMLRDLCTGIATRSGAAGVILVEGVNDENRIGFLKDLVQCFHGKSHWLAQLSDALESIGGKGYCYLHHSQLPSSAPKIKLRPNTLSRVMKRTDLNQFRNLTFDLNHPTYRGLDVPKWKNFNLQRNSAAHGASSMAKSFQGKESEFVSAINRQKKTPQKSESENPPRFLQAKVTPPKSDTPLQHVLAGKEYCVLVFIGEEKHGWAHGKTAMDEKEIFKSPTLKKAEIQLLFYAQGASKPQWEVIDLPRKNDSTVAKFQFDAPKDATTFAAEILAIHRGKLVQQIKITVPVAARANDPVPTGGVTVQMVACNGKRFQAPAGSLPFGACVQMDTDENGNTKIKGLAEQKPLWFNLSNALKENLEKIKSAISDAVDSEPVEDLFDPKNMALLLRLAIWGRMAFDAGLKDVVNLDGPIQITSNREDFVPLDWIYTLAPPSPNAKLCAHAAEALRAGSCMDCPSKPVGNEVTDTICPFGFFCLSHVVERHSFKGVNPGEPADFSFRAEPSNDRKEIKILDQALFAASARVDAEKKECSANILKSISGCTGKEAIKASNWKDWNKQVLEESPNILVLVVHIEHNNDFEIDQIEIETDFLLVSSITPTTVKPPTSTASPFVIALGCQSVDSKNVGFDLSSKLLQSGAAIVFSSFTTILGRQMDRVIDLLLKFLKENANSKQGFGEIVLKLRQTLLSEGIIIGMSLVAFGDADWKIKT